MNSREVREKRNMCASNRPSARVEEESRVVAV